MAAAGEGLFSRLTDQTPGGCACFPAGTTVATPHGTRAIETLHVGAQVLAEDPATGKIELEAVQAVIDDGVKPLLALSLSDGETITVTADHPFYVDGGALLHGHGWLQAGQLWLGDHLRTASGGDVQVVGLRRHVGRAEVYTLTVAKDHTFFVGQARVLVHNSACPRMSLQDAERAVTTGTGIQHGFRHVADVLNLGNWNKASGAALSEIVKDALTSPDAVVRDWVQAKGGQLIDIYIKKVGGHPLPIYVDKATGRVTTTVIASAGQLANWGVSL